MELSIERIKQHSEERELENHSFRKFLKAQDADKVDRIVHELHDYYTEHIDCTQCGNCCRHLRPGVSDAEIRRLAAIDNISPDDFSVRYIEQDKLENIKYLKDTPCKYLKNKQCTVYSDRPEACREYPYTHKPDLVFRTITMINNYGVCPIVFNLIESLKQRLNFRY